MILDENYKKELEEAALLPDYIPPLEDDDKEEVAVFAITTMLPFWRVVIYATLHEKMMFEAIMNEVLSVQMPDYFNERLDAKQLFRALRMVDGDCLRYILNKLDGADSVYNRLLNSVNDNNEAGFNEIICDGVTDTRPIVKICNCLRLLYEFYDGVDELNNDLKQCEKAEKSSDDVLNRIIVSYIEKALYKVKIVLSGVDYTDETHEFINKIFKTLKDFVNDVFEHTDNDVFPTKALNNVLAAFKLSPLSQEHLSFLYGIMLYLYFFMRDGSVLKTSKYTLDVLRGIILTPQQKEIWSEYDISDNAHEKFESVLDEMMKKVILQEDATSQSTEHPNEIEASQTEYEHVFDVIISIIDNIDEQIHESYDKEKLVAIFRTVLLDGSSDYQKMREYIMYKTGRATVYKDIVNITHLCYIFGYLMYKKVFKDDSTTLARLINVVVDPRCSKTERNMRSYIQKGKDGENLNHGQKTVLDDVLSKSA